MAWHRSHCCHHRHCPQCRAAETRGFLVLFVVIAVGLIVKLVHFVVRTTVAFVDAHAFELAVILGLVPVLIAGVLLFLRARAHRAVHRLDQRVRALASSQAASEADIAEAEKAATALEPLPAWLLIGFEALYRQRVAVIAADRRIEPEERRRLEQLRRLCRLGDDTCQRVETEAFLQAYAEAIVDGKVSDHELQQLEHLRDALVVPTAAIRAELAHLRQLSEVREELQPAFETARRVADETLKPISVLITLRRGEECYYTGAFREKIELPGERGRHDTPLVDRLLDGAVGTLYVTNQRLLLSTDQVRPLLLRDVLDVKFDPELRLVALVLVGAIRPRYFVVDDPVALATLLDRVRPAGAPSAPIPW